MKTYSDEEIMRYADGEMDEQSAASLHACLESDPMLAERVDAMLASQLPYPMAYKLNPPPPMPDSIRETINTWTDVARHAKQGQAVTQRHTLLKVAGVVAAVGVSFLLGYGSANFGDTRQASVSTEVSSEGLSEGLNSGSADNTLSADALWVERVADYQSLYVQETVDHIENGSVQAEKLLARSEIKDKLNAKIPDLNEFGYQFVRAQRLGFEGELLLQLVYKKPGRKPLALCFMPSKGEAQDDITLVRHENLESASWRSSKQRYVIVADESQDFIGSIARHARQIFL